jgi:hypothetical protein
VRCIFCGMCVVNMMCDVFRVFAYVRCVVCGMCVMYMMHGGFAYVKVYCFCYVCCECDI